MIYTVAAMPTAATRTRPSLNAKQEAFCRAVVLGASQFQAYADAGYSAKDRSSADANAAKLIGNYKIKARIKELQAKLAMKVEVTAEGQFAKLEEIRRGATKDGAYAASVAAVVAQNRLFGLEKVVTETTLRLASRSPDVPRELDLSVDEWSRMQTKLLFEAATGTSMNGNAHREEPEVVEHDDAIDPHEPGDESDEGQGFAKWRPELLIEQEHAAREEAKFAAAAERRHRATERAQFKGLDLRTEQEKDRDAQFEAMEAVAQQRRRERIAACEAAEAKAGRDDGYSTTITPRTINTNGDEDEPFDDGSGLRLG